MATFQHYPQQHDHPLIQTLHTFTHNPYGLPHSKTPTESPVIHTGYSPGPLITTPPASRNPSQPPDLFQDQVPEQLPWDNESFLDSPTSVMTPDADSMEVEVLDNPNMFYYQNGPTMSTQPSHSTISAMDTSLFITGQGVISDQDVNAALHDTLVSESPQYQQPYSARGLHQHQLAMPQYEHYAIQPFENDPWNGHGPPRSSVVPLSGHAMFNPAANQMDFSEYVNDFGSWKTRQNEDSYLPPSGQSTIPQDHSSFAPSQHLTHHSYSQIEHAQLANPRPIELHLNRVSPPPDNQGFVNCDPSHLTLNNHHTSSMGFPTSGTSVDMMPIHEAAISPPVASSISSEEMTSSYPASEAGMLADHYFPPQHIPEEHIPPQTLNMDYSLAGVIPEKPYAVTHDLDSTPSVTTNGTARPAGGRALGTHLEPQVAKAAHDMRKIVACWHCVLQRDKCGPGDTCERCLKRSQRPNADCGLGCSRIKLVDLSAHFLPALITQMHEDSNLTRFVNQYIHQWGNVELEVYMTCGQASMPRIPVKVYEFLPRGNALVVQYQYNTDSVTRQTVVVEKSSPALGMVHINYNEEKKYDKYITDIVEHHLDAFGDLCWEDEPDFLPELFKLMTRVKPKNDDEGKLLHEVFRLIVVTYIMGHTLTIAEENKVATLSRMQSYGGRNSYAENFTSPRMTNRQLKYFFCRIQCTIQATVLNKLQQIFKSSKGCDKWLAAFVAVLGMCMALEDQQQTIHLVMETKARTEGVDPRDAQLQADVANREIDSRMHFVQQIFRWKYNRKCNPLADADRAWDREAGFGDTGSVQFVRQVARLVKDNSKSARRGGGGGGGIGLT